MKLLVLFLGTIAIVHSASVVHRNYVNVPSQQTVTIEKINCIHENGNHHEETGEKTVQHVVGKIVTPSVIQYGEYVSNGHAYEPSQTTNIVGPSGSITEQKYSQSTSGGIYSVTKIDPVVEQHQETVVVTQQTNVANNPSEKTSVVGPSGYITQEKYSQSTAAGNKYKTYSIVENNPVKTFVVQNQQPVYGNIVQYQTPVYGKVVSQETQVVGTPSEKTSIVGPSGSITQEKYFKLTSSGENYKTYSVVETNSVTGKPEVLQYEKPVYGNIFVAQQTHSVSTPSANTNIVTGKPVVVQYQTPVYGKVVPQETHVVKSPSEKTSIVGPSGSITQEKYSQSVSTGENYKTYSVVETNSVTGKPVVLQNEKPVYGNIFVAQQTHTVSTPSANTNIVTGKPVVVQYQTPVYGKVVSQESNVVKSPSEKTSIVGPSGSITQEKYSQSISDVEHQKTSTVVEYNTVTGKPVVVKYQEPVNEYVTVSQGTHVVNSPSEKTTVVGPSGSITQEKYLQTTSNANNLKTYSVVVNSPVTGKPVVVKEQKPVHENVYVVEEKHVVNSPSEKTSIVGPSGFITQEKNSQSISTGQTNQFFGVVKNYPGTVKPVVVKYDKPVFGNVDIASEKTSVVGPSGYITQEKNFQPISNGIYGVVKSYPVSGEQVVVQYEKPVYGNVEIAQGTHIVSSPSEKTVVSGPSGSITQEKYGQSNLLTQGYTFEKIAPNDAYVVQYGQPQTQYVTFVHGNDVSTPVEKTSIVGPTESKVYVNNFHSVTENTVKVSTKPSSESTSQEPDCDDSQEEHSQHSQKTENKDNLSTVYYYGLPYVNDVVVAGNNLEKVPVSYYPVDSKYVVKYDAPYNELLALLYGKNGGNIHVVKTEQGEENTPKFTHTFVANNVHYPDIPKYPNVVVPDC